MPWKTSAASPSWGIHFLETKLETSISAKPHSESKFTNSLLDWALIALDSFCKPSRGPTSVMRISASVGIPECYAEAEEKSRQEKIDKSKSRKAKGWAHGADRLVFPLSTFRL